MTRPEVPEPPKLGVAAFFSCSEKEKAYEDDELRHGVFFHYVIEGLRGAAAPEKGEVTLLALGEYVTRNVGDRVRAAYGQTQRPEMVAAQRSAGVGPALDEATRCTSRRAAPLDRDQYDDALDEFAQALHADPRCAAAAAERGWVFVLRAQWDKALEDAGRGREADPRCALAWAVAGLARSKKGDSDKGAADCDEAVRLDPGLVRAYTCRAKVYADKGGGSMRLLAGTRQRAAAGPKVRDGLPGPGLCV